MTGGPSQQARVTAHVHREAQEAFNRATHSDALREMQIVPAEALQPDYEPPIGDPVGLIKSLGWRRLLVAAAFAVTVWTATAAFAVMQGGGR